MRWIWRFLGQYGVVSGLLRERVVVFVLLGFSFVYLLFSLFEISIWSCLWRDLTGWRCPGCGLTTGCKAILRGELREGVAWNWLAPVVIVGLALVPVVLALPKRIRGRVLDGVERFERKVRLLLWILLFFVIQTIARLKGWA